MVILFFSYSHRDETLRDELEIHLSMLKRQGVIDTWHDRRIYAGQDFEGQISEHIEQANIILLLVSPYFLASDYCYDVEMRRALEKHERGEARVIPVILNPCDWHSAPFGKLLAVPTDGKPVTKFPNQHDAFLEVVKAVRRVASEIQPTLNPESVNSQEKLQLSGQHITPEIRSSNLRIKKVFSERDRDEFLEEFFEFIAKFFEASLSELEHRNAEVNTKFRRIDTNNFSAVIYINGSSASQCRVWLGGHKTFWGGIAYSCNASGNDNSFNETLSILDDGYALFLKPMGMPSFGRGQQERELLSQQGAAEYFWEILMQPLQR